MASTRIHTAAQAASPAMPTPHPRHPRLAVLSGAAGALGAAALFGLAAVDLGDPEAAVRAALVREAEGRARLASAEHAARLLQPAPLAALVGDTLEVELLSPAERAPLREAAPPGPAEASSEVVAALLALAARRDAEGRAAEAAEARAQLALQTDLTPVDQARVHLDAVRAARRAGDSAGLETAVAALGALPFAVGAEGDAADTSPRLLGALAAAPELSSEARARLAAEVHAAFRAGELTLPRDAASPEVVRFEAGGPVVRLDPRAGALGALLEARLPLPATSWREVLGEPERAAAALASALGRELEALPNERWVLVSAAELRGLGQDCPEGFVVAVRRAGAAVHAAMHSEAALRANLAALARGGEGAGEARGLTLDLVPAAEAPAVPPPAELLASAPLPGTAYALAAIHADPGARVAAEARRLDAIRAALAALGVALAAATWFGVRAAGRAARLARLRSTFVASVSHDLRTPLASIANLAENLEDGVVGGPGAVREYHAAIRREAARLARLVSGLLDFARIERGEAPRLALAEVDTASWLADLERAARGASEPHGVGLRLVASGLPRTLTFDADAVQRAALNLVDNAVRHSGTDVVTVRVTVANSRLVLEVADRGRGVPGNVREALFAPYACEGDTAGTGLGLAIVRSIAAAHGGTARLVDGDDGRGLTARLELTVTSAESREAAGA